MLSYRFALIFLCSPLFAVDFNHDVAPLIYQHCANCHRPGEAGPFALLTYQDVKKHARQIADVTARRFMPPWLPEPGYGSFDDEQRLTTAELKILADWAAAGAPEGSGEPPPPPKFTEGWQLGPPDLIVQASTPFSVPAGGPELYWNFILKPDLNVPRYVRAVEIRPGGKKLVHHANLYVDRARSAKEGPGMDPIIERTAFDPDDGHFLFWKAGAAPSADEDSWEIDPGNHLLLNVHLQPSGKPESILPQVGLYFTDQKPRRSPQLLLLEHDGALNIPAGAPDFVVSDDFKLPRECTILAVYPHAHNLAKIIDAYATLPSGERKPIIRINHWDPNWQTVYRYREPLRLPAGTVLSMRYHYDNSAANPRNPNHPPKRVREGNHAADEMSHLWFQVVTPSRLELQQAMLEHRLEKYPNDVPALLHLGTVELARMNAGAALPKLQAAVRLDPQSAEAHNFLGSAFSSLGRTLDAIAQFQAALALRPDYPNARFNLGNAYARAGRKDDAIAEYQKILAANPGDALAKDRLDAIQSRP